MGKKDTGHNSGGPVDARDPVLPSTSGQQAGPTTPSTGTLASAEAVEMCALTSPALSITMAQIQEETASSDDYDDTDEEKARLDAYKGVMRGLHEVSHTLSEGYQWACLEVQGLVNQSLNLSTKKDHRFVAEASTAHHRWVKAVQPAIDCLGKSMTEQSCLLEDTRKVGMEITKEILALYPPEGKTEPAGPLHDLTIQAFNAARKHIEEAFLCLHHKLPVLIHQHVLLVQAGGFLATIFHIMCMYQQEMDNMVLSQTIMPVQVIPNMWGVQQGVTEGLSLLGPPTCPASWPVSLVKQVDGHPTPTQRATSVPPVTTVKSSSGKSSSGSGVKKSKPKKIPDFWNDSEREREDKESNKWEKEKQCQKSRGVPILSLAEHEEQLVSSLTAKTAPHQVFQPAGLPSQVIAVAPEFGQDWEKTRRSSPHAANSLDDDPLSDQDPGTKSKGCKWDYTSPAKVVVIDEDDDEPLPSRSCKTLAKKPKIQPPTPAQQDILNRLTL